MKKILIAYTVLAASVIYAATGIIPEKRYNTVVDQTLKDRTVKIVQASDFNLFWSFTSRSTNITLTGSTVKFRVQNSGATWTTTITGSVDSVTNALTRFTPSNMNTNGQFDFSLTVEKGSVVMCRAVGDLIVDAIAGSGITNALVATTNITWSDYVYTGTAASGPYRAGTNIAFSSNGDGSVNINATNAVASIVAGTMITISTSGTARTVNHQDTSSLASTNNSGGTVLQDMNFDSRGHVTNLTSYNLDGRYYTETESDAKYALLTRTMTAGTGITGGGTLAADRTFNHQDYTSITSTNNSGGTVIQDIGVDSGGLGHITNLVSYDLDGRYYTETESDARFAPIASTNAVRVIAGTAIDVTTNGAVQEFTVNVDGTETFNASGATNLNGTEIKSGTVADARIASTIARDSELTQVLASGTVGVTTSGVNRTVFYKGSAISNVVEDGSPQLGADLDMNGQNITGTTGEIRTTAADAGAYDGQFRDLIATNQFTVDGAILFATDATYNIGAVSANRPQRIYASTQVRSGGSVQAGDGTVSMEQNDFYTTQENYRFYSTHANGNLFMASHDDLSLGFYTGYTNLFVSIYSDGNGTPDVTVSNDNLWCAGNITASGEIRTTAADAGAYDIQGRDGIFTNDLTVSRSITISSTNSSGQSLILPQLGRLTFDTDKDTYIFGSAANQIDMYIGNNLEYRFDPSYLGPITTGAGRLGGFAGTVGSPAFTFKGDEDSGVYRVGANSIGLTTAGTNALTIDANGNVLIASSEIRTTAADAGSYDGQLRDLIVTNNFRVNNDITMVNGNWIGLGASLQRFTWDNTGLSTGVYFSGGNIALGDQVSGADEADLYIYDDRAQLTMISTVGASDATTISMQAGGKSAWGLTAETNGNFTIGASSGDFAFDQNDVGIRNSSPTEALDVTGNILASGTIIGGLVGFAAQKGTAQNNIAASTWTTVSYDDTTADHTFNGGGYSTNTSIYTVPTAGVFTASACMQIRDIDTDHQWYMRFRVISSGPTTNDYLMLQDWCNADGRNIIKGINRTMDLAAGDTVQVQAWHDDSDDTSDFGSGTALQFSMIFQHQD